MDAFFEMFSEELKMSGLTNKPANIYNLHVDEAGLTTDPRGFQVYVEKSSHDAYMKSSTAGKTSFSVLFCCNAAGQFLPHFVVYKALCACSTWMKGGPPGTAYTTTASGWMEFSVFEEWFEKICLPELKKRHPIEPTILLFTDTGLT